MAVTILSATAVICSLGTLVVVLFVRLPDGRSAPVVEATPNPAGPVAPNWLERVTKKKIIVHTLDDKSIEGVLMERTEDGVILRAAKLLGENHAPDVEMAGEVFVPRSNVAFAQLDD